MLWCNRAILLSTGRSAKGKKRAFLCSRNMSALDRYLRSAENTIDVPVRPSRLDYYTQVRFGSHLRESRPRAPPSISEDSGLALHIWSTSLASGCFSGRRLAAAFPYQKNISAPRPAVVTALREARTVRDRCEVMERLGREFHLSWTSLIFIISWHAECVVPPTRSQQFKAKIRGRYPNYPIRQFQGT